MFKKMEKFFEDLQNSNLDDANKTQNNKKEETKNISKCPNCGANLKGSSCEYCGSILKTENEISTDELFNFDGLKDDLKNAAKTAREIFKEIF